VDKYKRIGEDELLKILQFKQGENWRFDDYCELGRGGGSSSLLAVGLATKCGLVTSAAIAADWRCIRACSIKLVKSAAWTQLPHLQRIHSCQRRSVDVALLRAVVFTAKQAHILGRLEI
jgi:hypothetical protein